MRWLLPLLLVSSLAAQSPLSPSVSVPVAIDTLAVRQLREFWDRHPSDSLACLYGGWNTQGRYISVDSAPRLGRYCAGAGIVGLFGFIPAGNWDEADVVHAMARVLEARKDLLIVGEIYAVIPVALADGTWVKAPLVWAAVRSP